jgi:alpha-galactosidase
MALMGDGMRVLRVGFGLMALVVGVVGLRGGAQQKGVAATPPMGWNSWDAYGLTITEAQFRANVDVMVAKLKPAGYQYAVIDEGWFFENPQDRPAPEKLIYAIDGYGRYVPVPARFPSAVSKSATAAGDSSGTMKFKATVESTSFVELGSWVHGQGLKFGIHIVRGIPRASVERNLPVEGSTFKAVDVADQSDACPWDPTNWGVKDNAAGQAWYDSLMRQYAGWGVDLIKVDCIASHPYKVDEIRMIRRAIDKTGRLMVLSLSPGPTALENAAEVGGLAQMWRISDDIWDVWQTDAKWPRTVKSQFETTAAWAKYSKAGNWPDADMLPVGVLGPVPGWGKARTSRLTHDEQRTLLTLWAIARSPLIVGANLTELDDWTVALLTNATVIAMDQRGHDEKMARQDEDLIAWTSKGDGGKEYLAVFNGGDAQARVALPLSRYGFAAGEKYSARDVWEGKDLGKVSEATGVVAAHGVLLLELKK